MDLRWLRLGFATLCVVIAWCRPIEAGWKAGVGKANITPQEFMWMSGYAARTKPAEGKQTDLWAKALVLEDPAGQRVALVTLDLLGIDRSTSLAIRKQLEADFALSQRQVALCSSHTHSGPVVGVNLRPMFFLDEAQTKQVERYTRHLQQEIVQAVGAAVKDLSPCEISWGVGRSDFAVNRRENKEADVPRLREAGQLKGPVDHDVPVLKVAAEGAGKVKAIVFGYACHATVLDFYQWSGDYPGFAQIELEKSHPGAVALFWAGCAADQNPVPRRKVELAEEYGRRLAKSVDAALSGKLNAVQGRLATAYEEITLPLARLPSREEIEKHAQSTNRYEAARAKLLLARLKREGKLSDTYPYPVQAWRIGPELLFVTLGGEVVVDYSLRLKSELGGATFVAGYANDVMAYIPSRRVLREGGYEGGGAMVYYGLPTTWSPEVEEKIVTAVHKLAKQTKF
jgi:neutral ceramidase